ncbi:MAG: hypothetical protein ACREMZ_00710 [Gemmatimonadales bacterium]
MLDFSKRHTGLLWAVVLISACDSTSPGFEGRLLRVEGTILEAKEPPRPPLHVEIQTWPAADLAGSDEAILRTNTAGSYTADLGPFAAGRVDSLRVLVTQYDCEGQLESELRYRDLPLDGNPLVLPTMALSYRLPLAQFGNGAELCGAMITQTPLRFGGDHARLALWIDDISDSVRGRWRLNHSVSIGDTYGYFSGSRELDRATLQLRPTHPECSVLQLEIPVGGDNGSTIGLGELSGDSICHVSSGEVRFFSGVAGLSELLPPLGG